MNHCVLFLLSVFFIVSCTEKHVDASETESISYEKPKGITFNVDEVQIADSLLPTYAAQLVFENKLQKHILFFPSEHANYQLVKCQNNGLIETVQECYDNHRPLVLTPDVIWLAICQGVSIHINQHFDSLNNVLFVKDKPNQIIIRNDSLEYSAKHWNSLIASLSQETRKYTNKEFYSFFVPRFTTTTLVTQTAYQVTLLESYKKAFEYVGESGCGIPSIHIAGSKQDWQTMYNKLAMLDAFGLSAWANNLRPLLKEFISASEGKPNVAFWNDIYKNMMEYGAYYISGWIIKFFPYTKELEQGGVYDEARQEMKIGEKFVPNQFIDDDNYLASTLTTDNFPSGIAKVPITWNNHFKNTSKKIEVFAGFFAMKQYPDKSLEPCISWAICEADAKAVVYELNGSNGSEQKHTPDYWSPYCAREPLNAAVYNIKAFKTQDSSVAYLRRMILDSLHNATGFNVSDYANDTVCVEVLMSGKVRQVSLTVSRNAQLQTYVSNLIKRLPYEWFPALAHPLDVMDYGLTEEENKQIKVRVNSVVKIGL